MLGTGVTATATTATMTTSTTSDNVQATTSHLKPLSSTSPNVHSEIIFDDSQCLFCSQMSSSLSRNLEHMSKSHGLHIDLTDLLVDVESLLTYIHLLIFECHECIFCGTQRNTRQAVQQHMMAKGHCKYDPASEDSELYDFFGQSSSMDGAQTHQTLTDRFSDQAEHLSRSKSRKARQTRRPDEIANIRQTSADLAQSSDTSSSSASGNSVPHPSSALSTRVLKQEHTLQVQLSQLRAGDRQNLAHLPASQQRALLTTRHKQMEQARRTEQTYHSHLESSGNKFGRLSTIRLIRKPPHTGNVHSLNR